MLSLLVLPYVILTNNSICKCFVISKYNYDLALQFIFFGKYAIDNVIIMSICAHVNIRLIQEVINTLS